MDDMKFEVEGQEVVQVPRAELDRLRQDAAKGKVERQEAARASTKAAVVAAMVREEMGEIAGAVEALPEATEPQAIRMPGRKPVIGAMLADSDTHYGEIVDPSQMLGCNAWNPDLCEEALDDLTTRQIRDIRRQRKAFNLDHVLAANLGDMVDGWLREEALATTSFPPPVQAVRVANLYAERYRRLACEVGAMEILFIAGNHDRMTRKIHASDWVETTYTYVIAEIVKARLSRSSKVRVVLAKGETHIHGFMGRRYGFAHGHTIPAHLQTPNYRAERKYRDLYMDGVEYLDGLKVECLICGHFHQESSAYDGRVRFVPSLAGTNPWAKGKGFRSRPGQMMFLAGKHGIFNATNYERTVGMEDPVSHIDMEMFGDPEQLARG